MSRVYEEDLAACSIIKIEWLDHVVFSNAGWRDLEESLTPAICVSVGFLLRDTPDYYELVETVTRDGPVGGNHRVILKSTVLSVEELGIGV